MRPVLGSRDIKMTEHSLCPQRDPVGNRVMCSIMSTYNRKHIKKTYTEDLGDTAGKWQLFLGELREGRLVEELMFEVGHVEE